MDGRLVQVATMHGSKVEQFDLLRVMQKRLVITGSTMRPRSSSEKAALAQALRERVWPVLSAGRCKPQIYATFPLKDAAKAHALMESSQHIGKIMLKVAT
jgi:NADPH2:quinone reductase